MQRRESGSRADVYFRPLFIYIVLFSTFLFMETNVSLNYLNVSRYLFFTYCYAIENHVQFLCIG